MKIYRDGMFLSHAQSWVSIRHLLHSYFLILPMKSQSKNLIEIQGKSTFFKDRFSVREQTTRYRSDKLLLDSIWLHTN